MQSAVSGISDRNIEKGDDFMRELSRLPEGASADEKIRIIYDWLYELQMEMKEILRSSEFSTKTPMAQNDSGVTQEGIEKGVSE